MDEEQLDRKAREIASDLRASASPKEIFKFKLRYREYGRRVIREEANELMDDDLENREELVERVTDVVIEGLEKLPG